MNANFRSLIFAVLAVSCPLASVFAASNCGPDAFVPVGGGGAAAAVRQVHPQNNGQPGNSCADLLRITPTPGYEQGDNQEKLVILDVVSNNLMPLDEDLVELLIEFLAPSGDIRKFIEIYNVFPLVALPTHKPGEMLVWVTDSGWKHIQNSRNQNPALGQDLFRISLKDEDGAMQPLCHDFKKSLKDDDIFLVVSAAHDSEDLGKELHKVVSRVYCKIYLDEQEDVPIVMIIRIDPSKLWQLERIFDYKNENLKKKILSMMYPFLLRIGLWEPWYKSLTFDGGRSDQ
jgi:hypothetical protein